MLNIWAIARWLLSEGTTYTLHYYGVLTYSSEHILPKKIMSRYRLLSTICITFVQADLNVYMENGESDAVDLGLDMGNCHSIDSAVIVSFAHRS